MADGTGERRVCEQCGSTAILCSSGGVHRELLCECGGEMTFDSRVKLKWTGAKDGASYEVVGEAEGKFDY
jgi:hypothetical protein